jgi:alcohol dehydrogenase
MTGPGVELEEQVTFGAGAVRTLPALIDSFAPTRVLLVCGKRSFVASGAAAVLPELRQRAAVQQWSEFSPNPDTANLERGLQAIQRARPDLILGVGGGSAMDVAKLLAAYRDVPPSAIGDRILAGGRVTARDADLVLVPTTSGSGSEATHFSVVYHGGVKYSVAGPAMRPDAVILDPQLSTSASRYQRASSGIDAASQAIESLWARGATEKSRADAQTALRLLLEHIEAFVESAGPSDAEAMALGSHLAGRAINISKTTAAHALSYAITMRCGISHGHAVALTLGWFIQAHATADSSLLRHGVDATAHASAVHEILDALGAGSGRDAPSRWNELLHRLGLDPRLVDIGPSDEDELRALAEAVNVERLDNDSLALDRRMLLDALTSAT